MTGYFKGPSLTAHAATLGVIEAVLLPLLHDQLKLMQALSIGVLVAMIYVIAAFFYAIRGK